MPRASEEKQAYWRSVLGRQRKSGQSVRQFCAGEDLCCASFYRWKRKLTGVDRSAVDSSQGGVAKRRQASPVAKCTGSAAAFIPVQLQASGSLLEVVHPRGHVVRMPAMFDADSLRQVLDVLDRQGGA